VSEPAPAPPGPGPVPSPDPSPAPQPAPGAPAPGPMADVHGDDDWAMPVDPLLVLPSDFQGGFSMRFDDGLLPRRQRSA